MSIVSNSKVYRRGNDDKGEKRNKAEVGDEAIVEEGEIAEDGHLRAKGIHQLRPESKVFRRK